MRDSRIIHSLILCLGLAAVACARAERPVSAASAVIDDKKEETQSVETTVQGFTAVEGADLMKRLEVASQRASSLQKPYWSAYAFDVRPGVAVDPALREFNGSIHTMGDTSVFVGTTAGGITVETRNLAVFLLREANNHQITRMEVYNLERKREYSSYPVFWLGRANNEESLNYLRALSDASPLSMLSERAVLAISLHDDARVAPMLKTFVHSSQNPRIRSSSVYWLGQIGGEQPFLVDIVRNEAEDKKVRRQAAHAIGDGRAPGALAALQNLYESITDNELRRSIIQAAGNTQEPDAAHAFLLKVARNDPERDARRTAVRRLGDFERDDIVDELMKIYASDRETEVKRSVLQSLAQSKSPKAQAQLLELSRTESNNELRRSAIRALAQRGEAVTEDLIKLYDSESAVELRRTILQSLSEIKLTRVEDKLFDVARNDTNSELRRQAIRVLGERVGKRSFDFLSATALAADGNTEVQVQAVRAIGQRKTDESVPLLIKIARTHPNQLVRKQAIRSLGELGDPRAIEFFREVLTR